MVNLCRTWTATEPEQEHDIWGFWLDTGDEIKIPVLAKTKEQATEKANLIAAAPEMYEALRAFMGDGDRATAPSLAAKALAKAEGRQ